MTEHERFINEYCRNVGNIKIRCDDCKFQENCVDYGWDGCKKFTPKPSEPMTNEEWMKLVSVSEAIGYFCYKALGSDGCNACRLNTKEKCRLNEWLKEKHDG